MTGARPELEEADGQATARGDVAVMVAVADCLPVAVAGTAGVAMLHAGWRGLAAGILEEGVGALRELGDDGPLAAVIGPGARRLLLRGRRRGARGVRASARATLDLPTHRRRAGWPRPASSAIEDVGRCTICDERYFSYRREGEAAGRQAGVAWRT